MNYIEEAEKYLKSHRDMYRGLNNMRKERAKLIGQAGPKGYPEADYTQPVVEGGKDRDDAYNLLFTIKVLTDKIQKTEKQLEDVERILGEISQDEGCELYGDILRKWYIDRVPKEEIAQDARYCKRNIYKIKDKAIRKLAINLFGLDAVSVV